MTLQTNPELITQSYTRCTSCRATFFRVYTNVALLDNGKEKVISKEYECLNCHKILTRVM